jgi:hypothetical protein
MVLVSRGQKERNSVDASQKVKMFNYVTWLGDQMDNMVMVVNNTELYMYNLLIGYSLSSLLVYTYEKTHKGTYV